MLFGTVANMLHPPIIICGCPGSGTSLVTRMLRHAGFFAGTDAGPLESRKFHESNIFRQVNQQLLGESIDFPHAPKSKRQFVDHLKYCSQHLQAMQEKIDLDRILEIYWGDARDEQAIWGWKDPRNSANLMIWRTQFPDLRVLVIERLWSKKMLTQDGGSASGNWFRTESTSAVRNQYLNPAGAKGLDVYRVNFDQLLNDVNELSKLLSWARLPVEPADHFERFLKLANVRT